MSGGTATSSVEDLAREIGLDMFESLICATAIASINCDIVLHRVGAEEDKEAFIRVEEGAAGLLLPGTDAVVLQDAVVYPDGYAITLFTEVTFGFREEICDRGGSWSESYGPRSWRFECRALIDAPAAAQNAFGSVGVSHVSWEASSTRVSYAGFDETGALVGILASSRFTPGQPEELELWQVKSSSAQLGPIRRALIGNPCAPAG